MITRWAFYFDHENIRHDVSADEENSRIEMFINLNPKDIIKLPANGSYVYVNLSMVKCIVNVKVSQEQLDAEKAAQEQKASNG